MKTYFPASPYFYKKDISKILTEIKPILEGKKMLTMGEQVSSLEKEFALYCGTKYSVVTNSCTSALEICLSSLNLSSKDEVIVPVQTFIATGSSVLKSGAKIVFCDTNKDFILDFDSLKKKITKNTKAVIIVHFAGLISKEIFKIKKFLNKRKITLIEDAAHAHGASYKGVKAGNIGDMACFSFYATKIMTAGEGGIITMNKKYLYRICASLRNRGIDLKNKKGEFYINLGSNYRMTEIQAIICRKQLYRLPTMLKHRNEIAKYYKKKLKCLIENNMLRPQEVEENIYHSYWRFIIFLNNKINRNKIRLAMKKMNIFVDAPYMPLLYKQPLFKRGKTTFKIADLYSKSHISLPMHMLISKDDAKYIADCLKRVINE